MSHEVVKCGYCQEVIAQCRCPGPHPVRYVDSSLCPKCAPKDSEDKRLLKTPEEARDFVRLLIARAGIAVEDVVAEEYREARRLAPEGVSTVDMVIAVTKALREWKP